jgi:hypothetical protein
MVMSIRQVTISYGPIRADEAALYYGYVPSPLCISVETGGLHGLYSSVAEASAYNDQHQKEKHDTSCVCHLVPAGAGELITNEVGNASGGSSFGSSSSTGLCAVDHSGYNPASRPGKNLWKEFAGWMRRQELAKLTDFYSCHTPSHGKACQPWKAA